MIGLVNIVGTVTAGALGARFQKKYLLAQIYVARTVVSAAFILAPMTPASVLVFSALMGALWLATVPLTSGLVAQIWGLRYMGTLYGIVFLSHQLGAFLGVWLGGRLYDVTGTYTLVWWVGRRRRRLLRARPPADPRAPGRAAGLTGTVFREFGPGSRAAKPRAQARLPLTPARLAAPHWKRRLMKQPLHQRLGADLPSLLLRRQNPRLRRSAARAHRRHQRDAGAPPPGRLSLLQPEAPSDDAMLPEKRLLIA